MSYRLDRSIFYYYRRKLIISTYIYLYSFLYSSGLVFISRQEHVSKARVLPVTRTVLATYDTPMPRVNMAHMKSVKRCPCSSAGSGQRLNSCTGAQGAVGGAHAAGGGRG